MIAGSLSCLLAGTTGKNSFDFFDKTLYCVCPEDASCTGGTSCTGTEIDVSFFVKGVAVCDKDGGTCQCPAVAPPCAKYPGERPYRRRALTCCKNRPSDMP